MCKYLKNVYSLLNVRRVQHRYRDIEAHFDEILCTSSEIGRFKPNFESEFQMNVVY